MCQVSIVSRIAFVATCLEAFLSSNILHVVGKQLFSTSGDRCTVLIFSKT